MKKNSGIRRITSGQALNVIILIITMLTCSALASYHLHKMNLRHVSSGAGIEKAKSSDLKKSFPYNRYSNEVLMY